MSCISINLKKEETLVKVSVRSNLVKAEMRVLQKMQKNLIIYYIKR